MSSTLVGVLMIGGLGLYSCVGVFVARKLLHGKVQEGHNDVLVPMFLTAGVIYAVLLGFMVIAVWESYGDAKNNAASEAAALVPLYRSTNAMPKEVGGKLQAMAREYVDAVIEDEWPSQAATGKGSSKARRAIGNMFRAFGDGTMSAQDKKDYPFIFSTFMLSVTQVTNLRNKRNIQANEYLPDIMWLLAIGGAIVIMTLSFILFMEVGWPHMAVATVTGLLIGTLLYTTFLLSHKFNGPLAISAESFENTKAVFDDVDKGN